MSSRYLIIAAQFNELVTRPLVTGAQEAFAAAGLKPSDVDTIWVPGCFEIPVAAARAARSGKYLAVVCIGAIIRGDTPHFDYVAGPVASGLMSISVETEVPIIFGVLTTDTVEQALNRAGLKHGNKGADAARTALSMRGVLEQLRSPGK